MKKPLYEKNALIKGVQNAKENIETFRKAIEKEQETIIEYTTLINEHKAYEKYVSQQSTIERQTTKKGKT